MDSNLTRPVPVSERADSAAVLPRHALMFASFVLFYLLLCLPMLLSQWDGQDANGQNAALLLGLAPGAEDMLAARIGGIMQFSHGFSHPAPRYFLLLMLGKVVRAVVPLENLHGQDFATWASFLGGKSTYIFFHVVVLASGIALLVCEPRRYSAVVLLAFASGTALFLSFLGSWVSFSRYFAPAYIGLGVSFLMIMGRAPPSALARRIVAATMIAISLQSAVFLTEWIVKGRGKVDVAAMLAKRDMAPPNCVLVIDSSFVLDRPDIDFVHSAFGAEFVNQFLARLGRPACSE
jgi:hypothetical protein